MIVAHDRKPLSERASNAASWSFVEVAARFGVQFLVLAVLARLLSPADFGLVAMLFVFTSIAAIFVDAGFSTALIQKPNPTPDDETTAFAFSLFSGVGIGLALWLSAPLISMFYGEPALVPLVHLTAWMLPLGGIIAVPDAVLTKQLRFDARAKAQAISSGTSGAIAIGLAYRGLGAWSIAWQALSEILIRAILLWILARWRPTGGLTRHSFNGLFGFGSYMFLARISDTVYTRLQSLLLGRMFDASVLGYYTLAQNAQQAPANLIGTVLNRVGLPIFSEVADQPERLRAALQISLRISFFVFFPCMVGLALSAGPIIDLLYGPQWEPAAPVLTLLALSSALWPIHVLNLAALISQGHTDRLFRLEMIKKVVALLMVVLASPLGATAVAGAVLVASLYGAAVNSFYSRRILGYGLVAQILDQKTTLLLSTISACIGWSILHWLSQSLLHTAIAILVSGVAYIGGAHLLRSDALSGVVRMCRAFIVSR